jgi:uncharacterized protein YbjQ (UPF0145 family)
MGLTTRPEVFIHDSYDTSMKRVAYLVVVLNLTLSAASSAHARNIKLILPIAAAMEAANVQDRPSGLVKFFFGTQTTPKIAANLGSYVATPRTAAMAKSDEKACTDALLWTLSALEKRAQQVGANAVINIVSYYKKVEMESPSQFECHVGNVIVTVVLKGDLVKLADE